MTDRIKGVYVAFDKDFLEVDCEQLISAIRMLRGVLSVTTMVTDASDWIARERATRETEKRLWDALYPGERVARDGLKP